MKKFRLFALLAVLATFSTVFAAWNFITYADEYTAEAISITVNTVSTTINEGDAIELTATAPAGMAVSYEQEANNSYIAKATVSGSVNVSVKANAENATDDYAYFYKVYSVGTNMVDYTNLKVEDNATPVEFTVDDNGAATISAEDIAEYFDYDFGKQPTRDDLDDMNARIEAESASGGFYISVYATKK